MFCCQSRHDSIEISRMATERKIHILLIDDDQPLRQLFGAKLASAGYEVLYGGDAESGRELARRAKPDLILLDIRMPGTDGFTIAKAMREEKETKGIPIIFLTNDDFSSEAKQWVQEMYAADYIHKSVDLNEFIERIKKVLEKSGNSSVAT